MVVKWRHCYVKLTSSYHVASQRIQEFLGVFFKTLNAVLNGKQEKESIIRVRMGLNNQSLVVTACHHSASLVMPNGDPRDGFFDPTLTLMMDSYILSVTGIGYYHSQQISHFLKQNRFPTPLVLHCEA